MNSACLSSLNTTSVCATIVSRVKLDHALPMPLYLQVRNALSESIRNGALAPGSVLPSTVDLASQLGVSLMTAHRAVRCLADDGLVTRSRGKTTRVREDIRQIIALTPRFRICVAMRAECKVSDAPDLAALLALQAVATEIAPPTERILHQYRSADELAHIRSDGLVCIQPGEFEMESISKLAARLPVAVLGGRVSAPGLYCVDADMEQGCRAAVSHLVDTGHERITLMFDSHRTPGCQARVDACRFQMLAYSKPCDYEQIVDAPVCDRQFEQLIRRLFLPRSSASTAIIAMDSLLAMRVQLVLARLGIRVPGDVSLLGLEDHWLAERLNPPLTVVARPVREMARRAFSHLLGMINGACAGSQLELLPTSLIVRGSSAAPPARTT